MNPGSIDEGEFSRSTFCERRMTCAVAGAVAALALLLNACTGGSAAKPSVTGANAVSPTATATLAPPAVSPEAAAPSAAGSAGVAPVFAAPRPSAATPAPATPAATPAAGKRRRPVAADAQQVVLDFRRRGIPLGQTVSLTAADDPDQLLGQVGGYTSKTVFADSRLDDGSASPSVQSGGAVEFFASQRDAQRRFTQLLAAQKGAGQPEQLFHDGDVVLRLSPRLKADQVSEYEISARLALAGR
ncbi:MAG TPA: hypothetical protein VKV26_18700 [Dehalococcoidia bacterium]|nr:hypothetical protein [Dehalococcoidia bacterium]